MSRASERFNAAVDQAGRQRTSRVGDFNTERNRYRMAIDGGQDSLNQFASGAFNSLLPQFQQAMQGTNESLQRRGIANGETAAHGVNTTARGFNDALANALASQSMNLYGTQLGAQGSLFNTAAGLMESGEDRYLYGLGDAYAADEAAKNRSKAAKMGIFQGVAGIGGAAAGGFFGGR